MIFSKGVISINYIQRNFWQQDLNLNGIQKQTNCGRNVGNFRRKLDKIEDHNAHVYSSQETYRVKTFHPPTKKPNQSLIMWK